MYSGLNDISVTVDTVCSENLAVTNDHSSILFNTFRIILFLIFSFQLTHAIGVTVFTYFLALGQALIIELPFIRLSAII